jgi:hypothetical protein
MKKISEITPDTVLAGMLDNAVIVTTSKTQNHSVRAYGDGETPNTISDDEFISIGWNGNVQSVTFPVNIYKGNLILSIYVKTQSDGRVKKHITAQIVERCVRLIDGKAKEGYCFTLNPSNVITPTTVNLTTGYSTKILNVEWHTTSTTT